MAKTTTDLAALAEQLRADFETLGDNPPLWPSLCADTIEIHHVPAGPGDGPMDGTLMPQLVGWEHTAFRQAAPDWGYRDVTADLDGDTIHFQYNLCGTLPDGKQYSCPTELRLQIRDGRITRLEGTVGEAHANFVRELIAAGGFEMPADLIAAAMKAHTQTS